MWVRLLLPSTTLFQGIAHIWLAAPLANLPCSPSKNYADLTRRPPVGLSCSPSENCSILTGNLLAAPFYTHPRNYKETSFLTLPLRSVQLLPTTPRNLIQPFSWKLHRNVCQCLLLPTFSSSKKLHRFLSRPLDHMPSPHLENYAEFPSSSSWHTALSSSQELCNSASQLGFTLYLSLLSQIA